MSEVLRAYSVARKKRFACVGHKVQNTLWTSENSTDVGGLGFAYVIMLSRRRVSRTCRCSGSLTARYELSMFVLPVHPSRSSRRLSLIPPINNYQAPNVTMCWRTTYVAFGHCWKTSANSGNDYYKTRGRPELVALHTTYLLHLQEVHASNLDENGTHESSRNAFRHCMHGGQS